MSMYIIAQWQWKIIWQVVNAFLEEDWNAAKNNLGTYDLNRP